MPRLPFGCLLVAIVGGMIAVVVLFLLVRAALGPAPVSAPVPKAVTVPTATPAPAQAATAAPKPAAAKPAEQSPEVLLATIQHGPGIGANDPRVPPFARLLDTLQVKCTEDRGKLADLTAGANKVMGDRGAKEPIIDTLSGVATASEGLPSKQGCTDLFTAYALMRTSGVPGAAPKR